MSTVAKKVLIEQIETLDLQLISARKAFAGLQEAWAPGQAAAEEPGLPMALQRAMQGTQLYFEKLLELVARALKQYKDESLNRLIIMYRDMAIGYHHAVTNSLEEAIANQHEVVQALEREMARLGEAAGEGQELKLTRSILAENLATGRQAYKELCAETPLVLQESVAKLTKEWDRVANILGARKRLPKSVSKPLDKVVLGAAMDVDIPDQDLLTIPGDAASLTFFSYIENFAVLTLPQLSIDAPWEWSLIWHELAGYKVRQLNSPNYQAVMQGKVQQEIDSPQFKEAETVVAALSEEHLQGELGNMFRGPLQLVELWKALAATPGFSLASLFHKIIARLLVSFKYAEIENQGWTEAWITELFEDAYAVLPFQEPFIDIFFGETLGRKWEVDDLRHPPRELREKVARELAKLAQLNAYSLIEPGDEQFSSKDQSAIVAAEIWNFYILIHALDPTNDKSQPDSSTDKPQIGSPSSVAVIDAIRQAMEKWVNTGGKRATQIRNEALKTIKAVNIALAPDKQARLQEFWLDLTHDELLNIEFFETDFATSTGNTRLIEAVINGKKRQVNGVLNFLTPKEPKNVGNQLVRCRYTKRGKVVTEYTTKTLWDRRIISPKLSSRS